MNMNPYRLSMDPSKTGAPGRTRTCDPRLRRPVLYPTELRAHNNLRNAATCCGNFYARNARLNVRRSAGSIVTGKRLAMVRPPPITRRAKRAKSAISVAVADRISCVAEVALDLSTRAPAKRRDVRHLGRIVLVDRPDVAARGTAIVVHDRVLAGRVESARRDRAAGGTGLNGHGNSSTISLGRSGRN